ncbi:hypothetical protein VTK73DRAFT_8609 [Phialemonium thermophilum]|uniref:Uncharacterized protein n=1 Tax=Phialemonium thermophilum TaxID=223376 RepID=A0ABR3XNI7_9PEZI
MSSETTATTHTPRQPLAAETEKDPSSRQHPAMAPSAAENSPSRPSASVSVNVAEEGEKPTSGAAEGEEQQQEGHQEGHHEPLPLPAPEEGDGDAKKLSLGGSLALDELGPMVVNADGTLSRIANWPQMTQIERENTLRVLGKRNQLRLGALRGEPPAGEGGASGGKASSNK